MTYYIGDEEVAAVSSVVKSGILERYVDPNTSRVKQFEKKFSELTNCQYCLAVSSGTTALIASLEALNIGYGDEVIIPSYTYIATALAVMSVGAIPIIVNIDESLTLDPLEISKKITNATKAIIPVHMHGIPCDMTPILDIANKNKLYVIEDVAQACGGDYKGKKLGSLGNIGAFSFNHHKIISCGEGGAIITNDEIAYKNSIVSHHGGIFFEKNSGLNLNKNYKTGYNFRLSEISGAILLTQLDRLDIFLRGLRNEKEIINNKIKELNNTNFYVSPVSDPVGDCARTVFITFDDTLRASKAEKLLKDKGIDSFLAFSEGHTATCWNEILSSKKILKRADKNSYIESNFSIDITSIQKSEQILKKTLGIKTTYNRNTTEINLLSETIKEVLNNI